jgi:hypothetical protein
VKRTPYSKLPKSAFWRSAVAEVSPFCLNGVHTPKWPIEKKTKIATAGSCFAQHVTRALRATDFTVLDLEPPTLGLLECDHQRFGYGIYSARFGNIYTAQQLLTIAKEALCGFKPVESIWTLGNRFIDALRPGVEPDGLLSSNEVARHREFHLEKVQEMFLTMDLFIFTLGLTESWVHVDDGTVYPMCPGTVAGAFDPARHQFRNFGFQETLHALEEFRRLLLKYRQGRKFRMLLTVSPVPLTATASGQHVLQATTYSKSVLRAVAGELAGSDAEIDYFPSFEIITNPASRSMFYDPNLRTVRPEGVNCAMTTFLNAYAPDQYPIEAAQSGKNDPVSVETTSDLQCEEYLLEAFSD